MSSLVHVTSPQKIGPVDKLENLPRRIRDIATLRGLGYSFREIGREFEVTPQAISVMLLRHRRVLKQLKGAIELQSLSARAVNALGRHGVHTREEAIRINVLALLKGERNCGAKTFSELERWIAGAGCLSPLSGADVAVAERSL